MDPDLTAKGIQECQHAARLLKSEGFDPDVVYTSRLKRSIKSAWIVLEGIEALFLPVFKTFRLNQRMYGSLQGLSKPEAVAELGSTAVEAWSNSLKARPPPLAKDDPNFPTFDRRYADLSEEEIPATESLLDCQERVRPLWEYKIRKDLKQGKTVLVVGHRDNLRGLVRVIDDIGEEDIQDVRIPRSVPFVYRFDENMKTIKPVGKDESLTQVHTNCVFLEKPGKLKEALAMEKKVEQDDKYLMQTIDASYYTKEKRVSSLKASLKKLRHEQNLLPTNDEDAEMVELVHSDVPKEPVMERWTDDPGEFEDYDEFAEIQEKDEKVPVNVVSLPVEEQQTPKSNDGVVVFIRHGRTPHNNLGLFTGWEDPPLAEEGVDDARNAGRLLKRHNFEFDVGEFRCRF
jgi:2,3-bisphosphoglycerate-dependent phosphoglycerate mutase